MPAMPEPKGATIDPARSRRGFSMLEPQRDAHASVADLTATREADMRLAQDLMFFAYRDFTNAADVILEELGFGRAHHRALHFIGRNPGITVSDLLLILRITKQSLARVLGALVERGYVAQSPGREDRRQRLLTLTPAGEALERRCFESQQERLAPAYRDAGPTAVEGFRRVMQAVMDDSARAYIEATHGPCPSKNKDPV
jgi:DNA-binding MarR family transcriptional regulator